MNVATAPSTLRLVPAALAETMLLHALEDLRRKDGFSRSIDNS